jgi:hypothetical protein
VHASATKERARGAIRLRGNRILCSTRCESKDEAVATARQFVDERAALLRRARDQLAAAQDKQKNYADKSGRKNKQTFCVGDKVLLSIKNLSNDAVTTLPSGSKLLPRFIGPYTVVEKVRDLNYKLDLPTRMTTHRVLRGFAEALP